jgi:hypothetical protein
MPLFWFARRAALARGWSVLAVDDELDEEKDDRSEWAHDRAERALDAVTAIDKIVIGKSLTSLAADLVAEREHPAVWLTPLTGYTGKMPGVGSLFDGLSTTGKPALLIGSSTDPSWDVAAIPDNPVLRTLELEGLDHSLEIPGDPLGSIEALSAVVRAIDEFLGDLVP